MSRLAIAPRTIAGKPVNAPMHVRLDRPSSNDATALPAVRGRGTITVGCIDLGITDCGGGATAGYAELGGAYDGGL